MAGNRKAATEYLVNMLEEIAPGGVNKEIAQKSLDSLSDKDFELLMKDYASGDDRIPIYVPNWDKETKVTVENNLKVAKKLNHEFFQRLQMTTNEGTTYLTENKFMVIELPVRRQAQLLYKKLSVPEHTKSIDQLSGQAAGASRSARISYPELQIMRAMGLDDCLVELMKFRGGDIKGFDAMNKVISQQGTVNLGSIEQYASGVVSTHTLKTFLTAMHLKSTL